MEQTKIIGTIGPASSSVDVLKDMIDAGLDVARINFSHGDRAFQDELISNVRAASDATDTYVPIMFDTMGPEIRTGLVKGFDDDREASVTLEPGSGCVVVGDEELVHEAETDASTIYVSYEGLARDVHPGTTILIDDGKISLEVVEIDGLDVHVRVVDGGELTSRKGVNVPDAEIMIDTITGKDEEDLQYAVRQDADYVALSFVRSAHDVIVAREYLEEHGGGDVEIIAKIEAKSGTEELDDIISVADGIMVARGDLGVELPYSSVPRLQREMIETALQRQTIVVTATQMLESMTENSVPTRAEANDVFNAVMQSTTCVMLSAETAVGEYPVESVAAMRSICQSAEETKDYKDRFDDSHYRAEGHITPSVCYGAVSTAYQVGAKAIVAFSKTGHTARNISALRPDVPIIAVCPTRRVARRVQALWGVVPCVKKDFDDFEAMMDHGEASACDTPYVERGDAIVVVAGTPMNVSGSTNTMRVTNIGDVVLHGMSYGGGRASGSIRLCHGGDLDSLGEGDVAVVYEVGDIEMVLDTAGAVLAVGQHYDQGVRERFSAASIPVLMDVRGVEERVEEGMSVDVLADKGVVLRS